MMIWILATRGASTKLRSAPFTETTIQGVHSVVYKPGIEPVPLRGDDETEGLLGRFARGLHRVSGVLFCHDGSAAETLFGMTEDLDLIIRYRAAGQSRRRTLSDVIFVGDATVTFPSLNDGTSELVGVPFRVQIPQGETIGEHVVDALDS